MNESPTNIPTPDSPVRDEQALVIASLRHQITMLLLVLIVVSGTLTLYLFYQSRVYGHDLTNLEPQAKLVIDNYSNNWPKVQKVVRELVLYGQKHPDFQPILKKYGIPLTLPAQTNSPPKK